MEDIRLVARFFIASLIALVIADVPLCLAASVIHTRTISVGATGLDGPGSVIVEELPSTAGVSYKVRMDGISTPDDRLAPPKGDSESKRLLGKLGRLSRIGLITPEVYLASSGYLESLPSVSTTVTCTSTDGYEASTQLRYGYKVVCKSGAGVIIIQESDTKDNKAQYSVEKDTCLNDNCDEVVPEGSLGLVTAYAKREVSNSLPSKLGSSTDDGYLRFTLKPKPGIKYVITTLGIEVNGVVYDFADITSMWRSLLKDPAFSLLDQPIAGRSDLDMQYRVVKDGLYVNNFFLYKFKEISSVWRLLFDKMDPKSGLTWVYDLMHSILPWGKNYINKDRITKEPGIIFGGCSLDGKMPKELVCMDRIGTELSCNNGEVPWIYAPNMHYKEGEHPDVYRYGVQTETALQAVKRQVTAAPVAKAPGSPMVPDVSFKQRAKDPNENGGAWNRLAGMVGSAVRSMPLLPWPGPGR